MSDNVTALPGVVLKSERGVVDPELVAALERRLADAKAGLVDGIAYAVLSSDGMVMTHWVGSRATSNEMHGAISLLAAYFGRARLAQCDEDDG